MTRVLYTVAVLILMVFNSPSQAATATFTTAQVNPENAAGANDFSGVAIGSGSTAALIFDTPFAVNAGDSVTIYRTLFPFTTAIIRVGSYNGGAPTIYGTINLGFFAITTNLAGLVAAGCGAAGGCDYLEITTTGAGAFNLDAISFQTLAAPAPEFLTAVNNPIAAAAPEPKTWVLMLLAFAAVAARMKAQRSAIIQPQFAWANSTVRAAL